jgi:hypothetical protein
MNKLILIAVISLAASPVRSQQYLDPLTLEQQLLRREWERYEQRREEDAARRNLERYYESQPVLRPLVLQPDELKPAPSSEYGREPQQAPQQRPHASRGPATVSGSVACSGDAVGLDINIDGEIDAKTVESVARLFDRYHRRDCDKRNVSDWSDAYGVRYEINSRGGSVAAAMAIGRIFRREHAWLAVNHECISACVLILAGAVDRQIGKSAKVGIHRPYLASTPQQTPTPEQVRKNYAAMLNDIRNYLREMNVSERLGSDMLATPPEGVHFLNRAELKEYGLTGIDPAEQQWRAIENEARDVQEASQLGLNRQEYTRRKALGINSCVFNPSTGQHMTDGEMLDCRQRILTLGR